jgi:hypothetical protein
MFAFHIRIISSAPSIYTNHSLLSYIKGGRIDTYHRGVHINVKSLKIIGRIIELTERKLILLRSHKVAGESEYELK